MSLLKWALLELTGHILNIKKEPIKQACLSSFRLHSGFIYSPRSAPKIRSAVARLCHSGLVVPSHDLNDDKILHHGKLTSPRYSHLLGDVTWRRLGGSSSRGLMPSAGWTQPLTRHYVIGEKPVPAPDRYSLRVPDLKVETSREEGGGRGGGGGLWVTDWGCHWTGEWRQLE